MLYFAYGSNISETKLKSKDISFINKGMCKLHDCKVFFCKKSKDGSGKATILPHTNHVICGMLYEIDAANLIKLDKHEGLNYGYTRKTIIVKDEINRDVSCEIYIAEQSYIDFSLKPYSWYVNIIIDGMISNQFFNSYIEEIASVETMDDRDNDRNMKNTMLLKNWNKPFNVFYDINTKSFKVKQ